MEIKVNSPIRPTKASLETVDGKIHVTETTKVEGNTVSATFTGIDGTVKLVYLWDHDDPYWGGDLIKRGITINMMDIDKLTIQFKFTVE